MSNHLYEGGSNGAPGVGRAGLVSAWGRERRESQRHLACFPAQIQKPGGSTRTALIRDLSVAGALLLTRTRLSVGEEVQLSLYLSKDSGGARHTSGRVIRVEPRTGEQAGVWPFGVAVQFHDRLHDREDEIRQLAARQAALALR
jgi:hypothetical protein